MPICHSLLVTSFSQRGHWQSSLISISLVSGNYGIEHYQHPRIPPYVLSKSSFLCKRSLTFTITKQLCLLANNIFSSHKLAFSPASLENLVQGVCVKVVYSLTLKSALGLFLLFIYFIFICLFVCLLKPLGGLSQVGIRAVVVMCMGEELQ